MIRPLLNRPLNTLREVWHAWRFYRENDYVTTTPRYLEERDVTWADPGIGAPKFIDATEHAPPEAAPHLGWHAPARQYMFRVENAALYGDLPTPLDSEGRVLWEMLAPRTHLPANHISLRALYDRNPDLPRRSFDRPVVVPYTKHRPNYFHWLFDGLGRLKILEDAGHSLSDFDYLFRELTPWQCASLQALGVPLNQCHVLGGYHCRVDELVVLSCPRKGVSYSLDNVRWLRRAFLGGAKERGGATTPRKRVFIKRNAKKRVFLNRDNFLDDLQDQGFEDVFLEDLSFTEQIELFAKAEVVVGAHGAGLANILFCRDATVFEIFFRKRPMFYWLLARFNDLNYRCLQAADVHGGGNRERGRLSGVSVDQILRTTRVPQN